MTRRGSRGFSLIELIMVIILLSILTVAMVPQFAGSRQDALLRAAARELVAVVDLASSQAVTQGRPQRLVLDPARGRYWLEASSQDPGGAQGFEPVRSVTGAAGELDRRITLSVRSPGEASRTGGETAERAGAEGSDPAETIPFSADGTCGAREILLADQDGFQLALRLHPITSRVSVLEPGRERRP